MMAAYSLVVEEQPSEVEAALTELVEGQTGLEEVLKVREEMALK